VRRLRVQLTVLLALLGMLVVAWGATIFLGARDAARTSQSLQSTIDRFDQLRRRSGELGGSFVSIETGRRAPTCSPATLPPTRPRSAPSGVRRSSSGGCGSWPRRGRRWTR
jgi:hypothetical protein